MQSLLSFISCFFALCLLYRHLKNLSLFWSIWLWSSIAFVQSSFLSSPIASRIDVLIEVGRKRLFSIPAKLLHINIYCQELPDLWLGLPVLDTGRLLRLWVVTSVDSTDSKAIVKFYCLGYSGQFPRFPIKLSLVRYSTN